MTIRRRLGRQIALGGIAAAASATALADNPAETINVDANANRHAISPLIYGANWADPSALSDLNLTVNRRGGNATTTYNWQMNCTNRGGDWYFESLSDGPAVPGLSADTFINDTKAGGAEAMITIPLVDWVAKVGPNRQGLTPYSVAKYGAQTKADPYWPDAGNGILASDGSRIVNDPNDAYTPNSPAFEKPWVQHLVDTFGASTSGGIRFYLMDNEHGVWPSNHRPIVPVGPTMDSIRDRIIAYAGMVKEVDPAAQIVGPEEWGWPNYFNSPYDTQVSGGTDRANHGGMDYLPWLLQALKANNDSTGKRLLDVFSLHYYPQYSEFDQGDSSTAAQLKRNECTRDLWDPNYFSTSWISNRVKLIPRMKDWVNTYYPGTKIAITEYSWGAESHISGAIAEADVLGIFGREGVDLATFWGSLTSGYPVRNAFKMYRNYDGNKSTFGDTSVSATVANPDNVSAFAAQRSGDNALTAMVVCKYLTGNTPVTMHLANYAADGNVQVWQVTSANTITRLPDATVSNGNVSLTVPAQSITLLVVPGAVAFTEDAKALYAFEGDAQDASGNGNHGTATSVSYTTGKIGAQAAQFNGTGSNVSIPKSVTDDFTVAMWVKTTDTAGSAGNNWWAGKALVDGEVSGGAADWGTAIVNGKFVLGVGSTSGDTTVASSVNVNDGTWHHVLATRRNSDGAMAVYVDGVSSGTGTGPTGSRSAPPGLRIGASQPGWSAFLNGAIDDVRLYDRILSAAEITALASGVKPAVPTGLTATPGNGGLTLNWTASSAASGYYVKRATTSGGPYTTVAAVTTPLLADTNLTNGTTYDYVVTAVNTYGESANSAEVSATPLLANIATFNTVGTLNGNGKTILAATGNSFSAATFASNIATAFANNTGGVWNFDGSAFNITSGQSFTLTYGTSQANSLLLTLAEGAGGNGINQSSVAGEPTSGASLLGLGGNGATRTFTPNKPLLAVGIFNTDRNDATRIPVLTVTYQDNTTASTSGANADNVYFHGLAGTASNPIVKFAISQNNFVRYDDLGFIVASLAAPGNVTAAPGSGKITLAWSAVPNAASYTIQRASSSGGTYTDLVTGVAATNFQNTGLADGATWYYTVAANGSSGLGTASAPVSATTYTAVENWRLANFGTVANSGNAADGADPDGDGMTNAQEFTAGTTPTSAASALKVSRMQWSGNDMIVHFSTVIGKTYRLERSDTLQNGSWSTVQDNIAGTGGVLQITDPGAAAQSKRFYRVIVW